MLRKGLVLCAALAVTGCGDPQTGDVRGYIKPPLETPGLLIQGEDVSEMTEFGEPIMPRPRDPDQVVPREDAG